MRSSIVDPTLACLFVRATTSCALPPCGPPEYHMPASMASSLLLETGPLRLRGVLQLEENDAESPVVQWFPADEDSRSDVLS